MDVLISTIGILIILLCFNHIERQAYLKRKPLGDKGESIVSRELEKLGDDFNVVNDVSFGRTQIDHMVINYKCKIIFVIETKNWAGIIQGDAKDQKWKRHLNGKTDYYNNPILQNRYHCSEVRKRYKDYKVYNVVVFIKNNAPKYPSVIRVEDLVSHINKTTDRVYNKMYNRSIISV